MNQPIWTLKEGEGPLVAAAIHNGHAVRKEVAEHLALSPQERLREEDPYTGTWTTVAGTQIIGERSRFEVDLNRSRDKAVYLGPEDAWGLEVWKDPPPPPGLVERSLAAYDAFYEEVRRVLENLKRRHGRFVVFDLHSYNHFRNGPDGSPADPVDNPEVNVGTGTMDRDLWAPVVDRFIGDLRAFDFNGRTLDVRENVRFTGGYFPEWIHKSFPDAGCALAIEFKKTFMNEWTGVPDRRKLDIIHRALQATVAGVLDAFYKC